MFLQAGSPAELRAYMAQYPDSRCIAGGKRAEEKREETDL